MGLEPAPDPLLQTETRLWQLLETDPVLSSKVRPANRIKFTAQASDVQKNNAGAGDLPEVMMVPQGFSALPFATSTGAMVDLSFAFRLAVSGPTTSKDLYPLTWAFLCALARADANLGLPFVETIKVEGGTLGANAGDETRKAVRWVTFAALTVRLRFDRKSMKSSGLPQE